MGEIVSARTKVGQEIIKPVLYFKNIAGGFWVMCKYFVWAKGAFVFVYCRFKTENIKVKTIADHLLIPIPCQFLCIKIHKEFTGGAEIG